jgi:hypothetical protein
MIANPRDRFTIETAEGEIIAAAIIRPDLWPKLQMVAPEWYSQWSDQRLWQAVRVGVNADTGFCDPKAIQQHLSKHWPDETGALVDRLACHVDRWVHPEYIEYYLEVLRENGVRNSLCFWTKLIQKKCREYCPLTELKAIVTDPPAFEKEVTA